MLYLFYSTLYDFLHRYLMNVTYACRQTWTGVRLQVVITAKTENILRVKTYVGNKQNYIDINGKRYDPVTGVLLGSSVILKSTRQSLHIPAMNRPVVDGFIRRPKNTSMHHSSTQQAAHIIAVRPQKSKTLMRAAVKKPLATNAGKQPQPSVQPKTVFGKTSITSRVSSIPRLRQEHADHTQKSKLINRFGTFSASSTIIKKIAPLEVRQAPPQQLPTTPLQTSGQNKTADLLDRALQAAQGHTEPFYAHKKAIHKRLANKIGISSRAMAISTSVFAGLLLGGFYSYQNVPNLAMRVAAARAGFNATMPGYQPSGFAFKGPVQYSAGQVVVAFKSNSDERAYKLTQQTSNWSSDSLLNSYVVAGGKQYQTYQDRGRTIYIYDGTNATWVNGGIWYQVEGNSALSSDQLVRIATSL